MADRLDPAHLATFDAVRSLTGRMFGNADHAGTDDPVEYARLHAEFLALIPAYRSAMEALHGLSGRA